MTLNLAETSVVKSRPSFLHGANLLINLIKLFVNERDGCLVAIHESHTCW